MPVVNGHGEYARQGDELDDQQLRQAERLQRPADGVQVEPSQFMGGEYGNQKKEGKGQRSPYPVHPSQGICVCNRGDLILEDGGKCIAVFGFSGIHNQVLIVVPPRLIRSAEFNGQASPLRPGAGSNRCGLRACRREGRLAAQRQDPGKCDEQGAGEDILTVWHADDGGEVRNRRELDYRELERRQGASISLARMVAEVTLCSKENLTRYLGRRYRRVLPAVKAVYYRRESGAWRYQAK